MRKIKHILAKKEKLAGEYDALMRCADKSTVSRWRKAIRVMDAVEISQPVNIQPSHAEQIGILVSECDWKYWVDECESNAWTVPQLKTQIALASHNGTDHKGAWAITSDEAVISCDALITDPPYGILDESWEPKKLEEFTRGWLSAWDKSGAHTVLIFWSQRHLWDGKRWLDEELTNYKFQQLLIWHYPNNKKPQSRMMFKQTWEPILYYRHKDSDRQVGSEKGVWGDDLTGFDCHVAAVPQSNFNDAETKVHPAQKPVSVFRWLINAVTTRDELVCDPFCGSGTSGIAAVQLGRKYHGIETDMNYLEMAKARIATWGNTE